MAFPPTHYLSDRSRTISRTTSEHVKNEIIVTRSNEFYVESLFIAVDDVLFSVPRCYFESRYDTLPMLSPRPREQHGAGWFEDRPLILGGFTHNEFVSFLYQHLGGGWFKSKPFKLRGGMRLVEALKVSTALKLDCTREAMIRSLSRFNLLGLMGIRLARTYGVREWLLSSYIELVEQKTTIENRCVEVLGLEKTIQLLRMRDKGFPETESLQEAVLKEVEAEMEEISLPECRILDQEASADARFQLYDGNSTCFRYVIFKVEYMLFRFPVHFLTDKSEIFFDLFDMPCTDNVEGGSETNPIVLEGISNIEFTHFLHAIWPYPEHHQPVQPLDSLEYWTSVLKLSTMWLSEDVRCCAIEQMSTLLEKDGMEMEKVVLARSYDVQTWLMEAYLSLANRPTTITPSERQGLGWETAMSLLELRDMAVRVEKASASEHGSTNTDYYRLKELTLLDVQNKFSVT